LTVHDRLVEFHPPAADFTPIDITTLQKELSETRGAQFITVYSRTRPELVKEAPFHDLVKYGRTNGIVNFHYGEAVKRQQVREGQEPDFVPQPRKWGTRLGKSPFVSHVKDGVPKLYLEVKVEKSLGHQYRDHNDMTVVDEKVADLWLKPDRPSGQPTEKQIILRDYDMDNVLAISFGGRSYFIQR
jgi:hypothetical protein